MARGPPRRRPRRSAPRAAARARAARAPATPPSGSRPPWGRSPCPSGCRGCADRRPSRACGTSCRGWGASRRRRTAATRTGGRRAAVPARRCGPARRARARRRSRGWSAARRCRSRRCRGRRRCTRAPRRPTCGRAGAPPRRRRRGSLRPAAAGRRASAAPTGRPPSSARAAARGRPARAGRRRRRRRPRPARRGRGECGGSTAWARRARCSPGTRGHVKSRRGRILTMSTTEVPTQQGGPPTATRIPSDRISSAQLQQLAARVRTEGPRGHIEIEQPFIGQLLGCVPKCSPEDVAAAIERARDVQAAWAQTTFPERRAVLRRFHDLVLARQDEILDLIQIEAGKARHLASRRRRGALPLLTAAYEHHHPLGVVGIISPWNYPLTLSVSDATPALAAGNAVVIKPDSQTPFTALWGFALLEEAGLPQGLVQVVTGSGSELGRPLIDGCDYVMFTGSTATGRKVAEQAGRNLIGASMELGGKNAMIVLPDADLGRAVEGAERALFSNAGQLCISIERLYVHEDVEEEFTRRLVERVKAMKLGSGLDYGADMGSLISETQLETVRTHVEDARAKGAEILAGGKARPDLGPYFYEPTLLGSTNEGMTLFRDETFGPVVAISRFGDTEEVIARANDSDYGLNFSLWTKDTGKGAELAKRLRAGTVNVNEGYAAAWASVDAPMGGMKASGLGRRHGAAGILKYTESQTVAVQRLLPIAPPRGVPQGLWAKAMTLSLRILKRLPGYR